jgi:hypothetical protein
MNGLHHGQDSLRWAGILFDPLTAAISAGGSLVGGLLSSNASSSAANTQQQAANQAANNQMAMFNQIQQNEQPYMTLGSNTAGTLGSQLSTLTQPFNMTQAQLEQTPGYQFNLSQGLQGVQNSASARGLGVSGAALKGAANYASGLADNTYQNQFNNYQTNNNNAFNKLLAVTGLGQNAASQTGQQGIASTAAANNYLTSGANAAAAGTVGSANALSSGLNNASNALLTSQLYGQQNLGNQAQANYYNALTSRITNPAAAPTGQPFS